MSETNTTPAIENDDQLVTQLQANMLAELKIIREDKELSDRVKQTKEKLRKWIDRNTILVRDVLRDATYDLTIERDGTIETTPVVGIRHVFDELYDETEFGYIISPKSKTPKEVQFVRAIYSVFAQAAGNYLDPMARADEKKACARAVLRHPSNNIGLKVEPVKKVDPSIANIAKTLGELMRNYRN